MELYYSLVADTQVARNICSLHFPTLQQVACLSSPVTYLTYLRSGLGRNSEGSLHCRSPHQHAPYAFGSTCLSLSLCLDAEMLYFRLTHDLVSGVFTHIFEPKLPGVCTSGPSCTSRTHQLLPPLITSLNLTSGLCPSLVKL